MHIHKDVESCCFAAQTMRVKVTLCIDVYIQSGPKSKLLTDFHNSFTDTVSNKVITKDHTSLQTNRHTKNIISFLRLR